jgi:ethanolamine ammonia-lyase small subunit
VPQQNARGEGRPGDDESSDAPGPLARGAGHARPIDDELALLRTDAHQDWTLAPVALVEQGRVAIGDPIGSALRARMGVVLIGERPGLSSPDSLGVYFTWAPRVGLTDAQRNCISNVRDAGLAPERAAHTLFALLSRARALQLSGVALKDESDAQAPALGATPAPGVAN